MIDGLDETLLRRAMDLARRGRGHVEPNPMVGCVLARGGQTLAEGYHESFGGPHAERMALRHAMSSGVDVTGATAYVTLEPCCENPQKKTPPCAPALIEAKIARVVLGCVDPNPLVNGRSIEQLRSAGIIVDGPFLEDECRQLIAPFIALTAQQRPYVTLKWAQSADGKVAGPGGARVWISNEHSRRLVHGLRARCDAIMVGGNTVRTDDPLLLPRDVPIARRALRIILSRTLDFSPRCRMLQSASAEWPVLIAAPSDVLSRATQFALPHVELAPLAGQRPLEDMMLLLGRRRFSHLLVEAGPALAMEMMSANLADRVWVFHSPASINDASAPSAPPMNYPASASRDVSGDRLVEHLNPASPLFYSLQASGDGME